jgi:hypothetical protein
MSAGQVVLSANDATPQFGLGGQHVNYDLEKLFGPRAYTYVRNHGSTAWTKGLAVRQRQDVFGTEGTALTADANTVVMKIVDANLASPLDTAGYVPDTLHKILYQHASQTSASGGYSGRVWRIDASGVVQLEDAPTAAISNSGAYILYLPYAFITQDADGVLLTGGVTQANISAGYYGWVQIAGWGFIMVRGNGTGVADGVGVIPGETAGYGKGCTLGTNDALLYAIPNQDSALAAQYVAAQICVPGTPVMVH